MRRSRAGGTLPMLALSGTQSDPLHEQLYTGLRERILRGELAPGARLASTRALALELGVSRFTVVSAIDRLIAEGYLTTRQGAGTFVARSLPERAMRVRSSRRSTAKARAPSEAPTLSRRGAALSGVVITGPRSDHGEPRPFRPRRPPLDIFPWSAWAKLVRRRWSRFDHQHLDYGEPAGYRPLRAAIAEHVSATRGVRCSAEHIIVTSGAQQAFDLVFRLLLDPGDQAWIEEPGYLDVRGALVGAGARIVPVPVDGEGIDVALGARVAPRARLVVVSPSHQYPTGVTLSAPRRMALLAWAARANAWVIEDDYDSYFRYRGRPLSALQQLDADAGAGEQRVVYVGTFSKTMFPSLRLGYCVVPSSLVEPMANAKAIADRNSPIADQAVLAEFIASGQYDRHLRRLRMACAERHEAMHHHAERWLAGTLTLQRAAAGTHLLAYLSRGKAKQIARTATEQGLVVFPLSRYCLTPLAQDALVLGYGGLTPERIAEGMRTLAKVF